MCVGESPVGGCEFYVGVSAVDVLCWSISCIDVEEFYVWVLENLVWVLENHVWMWKHSMCLYWRIICVDVAR